MAAWNARHWIDAGKLKQWRADHGFSQDDLAKKAGLSRGPIIKVENGSKVSRRCAMAITNVCGRAVEAGYVATPAAQPISKQPGRTVIQRLERLELTTAAHGEVQTVVGKEMEKLGKRLEALCNALGIANV